jgi:DNA polymerase beta
MMNNIIIKEFERLLQQKKIEFNEEKNREDKIKKSFSIKNTENTLTILRTYKKEILTEKDIDEFSKIKGIGNKTIERIREIIKKGKLSEIKKITLNKNTNLISNDLENIIGIGKVKAHELVVKYNIKSIEDLIKKHNEGKIKLNDKILLGLKYHGIYKQEIPRLEIVKIDKYLSNVYGKIDVELFGVICGSYRREKAYSGDIDILITHPKIKTMEKLKENNKNYLQELIKILHKEKFLVDDLTDKNITTKYMGFCKYKNNPVWRIDFRYVPYESYYSALLYFTGSGKFNTRIRELAISLGYKLSEYGLYQVDEKRNVIKSMPIKSEKDIFDYLGLEYLTPQQRSE